MYIGEKKIKQAINLDGKTKVVFEDDSEVTFPRKMYDASFTQEPVDATELQKRRVLAVQAEFMQLLLDWNMKLSDIPPLLNWSSNYIEHKHELADEKLWGNKYQDRTIEDLESVLRREGGTGGNSNPASS